LDIKFGDKKLKKYANDDKAGKKKLGQRMFELYKQRLDQLKASKTLEDLRHHPGKFHELTRDRKGQWACNLVHPYRLIFTVQEDLIPTDDAGKYIWIEIAGVEILEITDYH